MKITDAKIKRVCDLRYHKVKVIPIALNEHLSEKSVRTILEKNYPTYVKIREIIQLGYIPWGYSQSYGKTVAKTEKRYAEGYAHQDANCRVPEHQRLLKRIGEPEQTIEADKQNNQIKEQLRAQKDEIIEDALTEIEKLNQIIKEYEKKDKDYEVVIQNKNQDILFLKSIVLNGIQGIQNDLSGIKIQVNTEITAVRGDIRTLTNAHKQLNLSFQKHNTTTLEKIKLEQELQTLKEKHSNDLLKYGGVAVLGFGAGVLVDRCWPSLLDTFITWINGLIRDITTGYTGTPNPQPGGVHPDIPYMNSGVNSGTNTPGVLCSGAYPPAYGIGTSTDYTVFPNTQDGLMQSDIQGTSGNVTISTITSGTTQSSGFFCSSHLEIGVAPQETIPVQIPSPFQTPINYIYIPLPSPLPDDLSKIYPMNKLRRLKGTSFEDVIEKLFRNRGCPVERLSYGNFCGDLIVTLNGVPTLIECKQKPKVGVDTIQRTYAAKDHYRYKAVTHCMVITTGEFTKEAREEAQNLGVELWDGKPLLEEIYKDQFFYLPENPEDYDPDK
ncbi:Restriction endonuclease [uncultured archaeon]|nr:Restriction endonuclease [uncultured archaeon]